MKNCDAGNLRRFGNSNSVNFDGLNAGGFKNRLVAGGFQNRLNAGGFQNLQRLILFIILLISGVNAKEPPKRIISLAPNITEIIYKLGAGDLLVGRTEYCLYPPQALRVPVVGGYLNPDFEKMVMLHPDVVFLLPNPEMDRKLSQLDLKPITLPNETIADIFTSIDSLGRLLNRENRAAALIAGIRDTLAWVTSRAESLSAKSALLLIGREGGSLKGLYAAGKDTYLSELLKLCSVKNAYADVGIRYFEVSKEDLIQRNPDLIVEFRLINSPDVEKELQTLKKDWQPLRLLNAVKNKHIYIFTERFFLIPGPRVASAALLLFEKLRAGKR